MSINFLHWMDTKTTVYLLVEMYIVRPLKSMKLLLFHRKQIDKTLFMLFSTMVMQEKSPSTGTSII